MSKKITSICLTVCLVLLSSTQCVSAADTHQPDGSALLKQKAELFGIGADVRVRLSDGQKIRGQISSIEDAGFTLAPLARSTTRLIRFDDTSELTLIAQKYRASGTTDASEARRAIAGLGIGRHIVVQTGDTKIHGHIRTIEMDHFVIAPDDEANLIALQYQDVRQVGKNLGVLSTIGLVAIIIVAIVVVAKVK